MITVILISLLLVIITVVWLIEIFNYRKLADEPLSLIVVDTIVWAVASGILIFLLYKV